MKRAAIKNILLVILCLSHLFNSYSQTKYEREYRIKAGQVPSSALEFICESAEGSMIKWYFEENQQGNSVEAKFKRDQKKFSVEFDTEGQIQDIEIKTNWESIPVQVQSQLKNDLDSCFSKYHINKIQIQYSGDKSILTKIIQNGNVQGPITTQYELVVSGRKDGEHKQCEVTLDESGNVIEVLHIVHKNSDNLEY